MKKKVLNFGLRRGELTLDLNHWAEILCLSSPSLPLVKPLIQYLSVTMKTEQVKEILISETPFGQRYNETLLRMYYFLTSEVSC